MNRYMPEEQREAAAPGELPLSRRRYMTLDIVSLLTYNVSRLTLCKRDVFA
jgi:hypothetical protein